MCLRYDIIHIVLRSFVIQIGYLCYFFITLNAYVNSGQCYVLECQKTNCIINLFRMWISGISKSFIGNIPERVISKIL